MPLFNLRNERTIALDAEFAVLQKAVDDAVKARTRWMDEHMQDYCEFKPGDAIYDGTTGRKLGTVSKLYRFHQNNPQYDTSMHVDVEFRTDGKPHGTQGGMFDNTSRQYLHFCTAEEAALALRLTAESLSRP